MIYFKSWTAKMLNKLQLFFEKVSFIRHQTVFTDKESADYVYFVRDGSFL